jgi:D-alanine-D-alanine ligase
LLHGAYGEDGTLQGLLEMAGVRYVGSGVLASAAAMDKAFTKTVLRAAGLDVGRYLVLRRGEQVSMSQLETLGLPLFVKPARAGSSIGISKLHSYEDLPQALDYAFEHDSKVLIEAAATGREIECGVLQDADGTVSASLPAEIRLRPDFDWYSFEAKYLDDASEFDIPPEVGDVAIKAIQDAACQAFRALDCAGLARVDFFLEPDGRLLVNEVNTMPGFTPISMYPKMWAASGVSYPDLLDRLINTALARLD